MADEDSYGAWKDRCDRYFTSISESESVGNGECDKSKQKKKWKTLRDVTSDDFTNSTSNFEVVKHWFSAIDIHGLRLAGTTANVLESIIWIIVPCVAFGGFVFFVYLNFSVYLQQLSSYQIESRSDRPSVPVYVTVCNKNKLRFSVVSSSSSRFRDLIALPASAQMLIPPSNKKGVEAIKFTPFYSFAQTLLDKDKLDKLVAEADADFLPFSSMSSPNDWDNAYKASLKYGFWVLQRAASPSKDEYLKYGHQTNETLVQCLYDRRSCKEVTEEIVKENYGRCFTIPSSNIKPLGELELRLNIESDEYIDVLSPDRGAIIFLHTQKNDVTEGSRYSVAPGSHYVIDLQNVIVRTKQEGCTNMRQYNKQKCISGCIDNLSQIYCECRQSFEMNSTQKCRLNVQFEFLCYSVLSYLASDGKLPCSCPSPCSTTLVESRDMSLPWPSEGNLKHEQNYLQTQGLVRTASQIRSSMVKVSIDMRNARETRITESYSSSLLQLLANIGGVSSLLIGVSIVSILEVTWLFFRACIIGCVDYCKRKQSQEENIEKLSDSDITSVTWAAYKDRLRYEAQIKDETIGCKGLWSQEPIRRNSGRRQALQPIPEETKSPKMHNIKISTPNQGLYTKYTPYNRYPSQPSFFNSVKKGDQVTGNEFPLFHSLDQNNGPSSMSENKENLGASYLSHKDLNVRNNPERGRTMKPADAIQMYGPSARKYFISEPFKV
ncbi:uncharacterized protein LOC133181699 [Saccostrea echinata]|uniref:uncharacterized protein LOC133181699 n=1 Tax=Saccostrea echinata TaxID=191078 RepID=UPI002A82DFC0|nr:uncharacterized protein LOC133181699 [Saccostrea echinata]